MKLASAFLSHASVDKEFVAKISDELGRRGVVPWLDRDRIVPGDDLPERFRDDIPRQAVLAVYLTARSVTSRWVDDELRAALDTTEPNRVIAVCDGNPLELVRANRFLASRWLHADGSRVTAAYVDLSASPASRKAAYAAEEIARAVYRNIDTKGATEVAVGFDQRGHGLRGRGPAVPMPIEQLNAPVLVFRPDGGSRTESEVLRDDAWERTARDVLWALAEAFGPRRPGQLDAYLFGDAQLGLPFLVGYRFFDRSRRARVLARNLDDGQVFGFDFAKETLPPGDLRRAEADTMAGDAEEIAIYIGKDKYVPTVRRFMVRALSHMPLITLRHEGELELGDVLQLIADALEVLKKWEAEHATQVAYLFVDLPLAVMPLLGAHLTNVMNGQIHFLEYRRDLQGVRPPPGDGDWYTELDMRGRP